VIRYTIQTFPAIDRINLSRAGQWGNMPHPSIAAAQEAARADAKGAPHEIDLNPRKAKR